MTVPLLACDCIAAEVSFELRPHLPKKLPEQISMQERVAHHDVLHVPAERLVARGHVLREGDVGVAVDGDPVVVIEDDEFAQAPVPGQRCRLVGDALHVATVALNHVPTSDELPLTPNY